MSERSRLHTLLLGAAVVAGAVLFGLPLGRLGVPSPLLFSGLLCGLVAALSLSRPLPLPLPLRTAAHAVVGITIGTLIDPSTLRAASGDWPAVLGVVIGTLALSVGAGALLRLHPAISPRTGVLAMIAGGAVGNIAMAQELQADQRMVAVLQYLRILLIVLLMPLVATTFFGAASGRGVVDADQLERWPAGLFFTVVCGLAGLVGARLTRLPMAPLLGPMLAAAAASLSGLSAGAEVPAPVEAAAFLVIGLEVGLSFTRASLRTIGTALPLASTLILALIAACAGFGVLLSAATGASALEGYLATTPGGMYAVLATATDSGADPAFVFAVQALRLFVMLLSVPFLFRRLFVRRRPTRR